MQEIWKDLKEYENLYQISNLGRVKSLQRRKSNYNQKGFTGTFKLIQEKILKPKVDRKGYLYVQLYKNGKSKMFKVHRLVAQTFIPNLRNKPQVNHKDGNKQNNFIDNLEWCTNTENQKHAWKIGLQKSRFSKNNSKAKKVMQYDLQGNFIREWNCMMDIEREINISHTSISLCCRNKVENTRGYIWKYKNAS